MANKLDIRLDLPTDAELGRMFDAVPMLERHQVSHHVVRAGAQPILKRARQLAPRSTEEMRNKRSKNQRGGVDPAGKKIAGTADWDYPLWKTIKMVVRKGRQAAGIAIIGPEWPKGNKAYFNTSPKGRRQVLWGKVTGRVIPQIRNWIVQALDETKPQQLAAMKVKLRQLMDKIWRERIG